MKAQFEQLRTGAGPTFNAFTLKKDEFDAPFHFHPEYELTFILSSTGTRYAGNHFEGFKENDMVLLGPNLPHCWKNYIPGKHKAEAIVIHWDQDLIDKEWLQGKAFTEISRLLHHAQAGIRFDDPVSFKHRLKRITRLTGFRQFHEFLDLLFRLSVCDRITILNQQSNSHRLNYSNHERVTLILDYIRKNYNQKITLKSAADIAGMSEEAFSRFFSRVMRKSFFAYLNEYRINYACTQLIETEITVSEICYASGYDTQPFFFKQFKKFKNCSPLTYRLHYWETNTSSIARVNKSQR